MIGGEHYAPRVTREQEELEADGPLQCGDRVPFLVLVRHDAAARLELDVHVRPLSATAAVEQVLHRRVGGERHSGAEHDLSDVAAQARVRVDVLDDLARRRRPSTLG